MWPLVKTINNKKYIEVIGLYDSPILRAKFSILSKLFAIESKEGYAKFDSKDAKKLELINETLKFDGNGPTKTNTITAKEFKYNGDDVIVKYAQKDSHGNDIDIQGKQNVIDSSHKLSADVVDDTSTTNKFVTSSQKSKIDSIFWIDADLSAVDFTPTSGKYYKHIGTTGTYTNGLIYYYNGTTFVLIGNDFNIVHASCGLTGSNFSNFQIEENYLKVYEFLSAPNPLILQLDYTVTVNSIEVEEIIELLCVARMNPTYITTGGTTTIKPIASGLFTLFFSDGNIYNFTLESYSSETYDDITYPRITSAHKSISKSQVGLGLVENKSLDTTVTQNSQNYISSGAVYTAISSIPTIPSIDDLPTSESNNLVKSGGVYSSIVGKLNNKPDGTNDLISNNNKVNITYIPDYLLGQVVYGGTIDATTGIATLSTNAKTKLGTSSNSITLTNDTTAITGYTANEGIYYIVTTSGVFAGLGLITGDWLISNGSAWTKIDNTDAVQSVAGKTGAVVLEKSDVGLGNIVNKSMDSAPTASSENYVQSGGVYTALNGKINNAPDGTNNLINNNKIQNRYLANGITYYVGNDGYIRCDAIGLTSGQCIIITIPNTLNSPLISNLVFKDYNDNTLLSLTKDDRYFGDLHYGQNVIRVNETLNKFTPINSNVFPITTNNLFTLTKYTHGRYIFFNTNLSNSAVDELLSQIPLTISTGMTGSYEIGIVIHDHIDDNYGIYIVDCSKFGGTGYFMSINNGFTVHKPIYISEVSDTNLYIARTLIGDQTYTYSTAGWQISAYDFNTTKPTTTEFTPFNFNYQSALSKLFNLCPDGIEYGETEDNVYVPKASPGTELWDMVYGIIDDKKPVLDSQPTQNSTNGITSGGVYTALTQVGNYITKTSSISKNDQTLITSGGIYDGLYGMFGIKPQEELIYGVTYYFNTAIPSSVLDEMIADIDWIIDVDTGEGEVGAVSSLIGDITDNHLELLAVNLENLGGEGYALIWATTADDALVSYEGLVYISNTSSANTALFQAMLDPNFVMPATAGWQMSSYTMATDINPIILLNGQTDTIKNKYRNLICNMITKDNRLYKLVEFMIDVIIDGILNTSV